MRMTRGLERIGLLKREAVTHSVGESIPMPPSRQATSRDPMNLDAVYRAISILETAARQLTVDVWKHDRPLETSQVPSFIRCPDVNLLSFGAFIAETVSSMAQRGNAFWLIRRDEYSKIQNLRVLNPLHVQVDMNASEKRFYSYKGRAIPGGNIAHLRLTHTPGQALGLSPLQACMTRIDGALKMAHYADTWMDTAGAPPGILTTDQDLSQQQAETYKEQARHALQYSNGPAVLGKGLKYERLLLNPSELQFLESQQANTVAIARMFGIPSRLMLAAPEGSSETYSNLEQENTQFVRMTLMAYLAEIEDALTDLTPNGQFVRFNLDGFQRSDTPTRYQAYATALASGFLSIDEVRAIEGLPPTTTTHEENTDATNN